MADYIVGISHQGTVFEECWPDVISISSNSSTTGYSGTQVNNAINSSYTTAPSSPLPINTGDRIRVVVYGQNYYQHDISFNSAIDPSFLTNGTSVSGLNVSGVTRHFPSSTTWYTVGNTSGNFKINLNFTGYETDDCEFDEQDFLAGRRLWFNVSSLGASSTLIPLGIISGAISMGNLSDFFGTPSYTSDTIAMSDLYKGGYLVPNISENSQVPTSGSVSLSNFYSSYTRLEFDKHPTTKWIEEFSTQSTGTMQAQWVMNITPTGQGDFDVGYGMLKASDLEYRWVVTGGNQLTRMVIDGNVYTTSSSTYTSPWGSTGTLQLERDWTSANQSFEISGTARVEVRKVWNSVTYTISSSSASWKLHKFNSVE
jgi:hypothetical protein